MQSQGHDAYECEGLTNRVGHRYAQMAVMLAKDVRERCKQHAEERMPDSPDRTNSSNSDLPTSSSVTLDSQTATITALGDTNILGVPFGVPDNWHTTDRRTRQTSESDQLVVDIMSQHGNGVLKWTRDDHFLRGQLTLSMHESMPVGHGGSVLLPIRLSAQITDWLVDSPFHVSHVRPNGAWPMKQPTGHWLTSEQRTDNIERPLVFYHFVCANTDAGSVVFLSSQNSLALAKPNGFDVVLFRRDGWDQGNWLRRATIDFALMYCQSPTPQLLYEIAAAYTGSEFSHCSKLILENSAGIVTAIRKCGEELEVRIVEIEGCDKRRTMKFVWNIASIRKVNLLGETLEEFSNVLGETFEFPLRPYEIATFRILFSGRQSEYLPIDEYRTVWVGD
jgi:hypothetical protein